MEALNTQLLRFFDWLLWTTIQGSVLIVMIVLIQKLLRRRLPIRWHYFVWTLLLIRLVSPWLPESKISIFNLVPRSVQQGRIIESYSQSQDTRAMGFYLQAQPEETEQTETATVRFVRALPVLWLAGTVIIAVYVCVRSIKMWRTVKRERPITDQKILDLLEDCKMQMRVETIVAVVVSDRIKSPALFGFIRPRLLLPQGMLETYSLEELRYVFIHELAHLKQRDIYLGWLMALLHVAHWFNPLMWFAFTRIRADREIACDRLAISTMEPDEPPQYGRTIVSLLESFSQTRYLPSVAGILEDKCQVERRIKMIADYKKTTRTRWPGAMLLLVALAFIVLTNAYVAKADYTFGTPTNLGPIVNSLDVDACTSISTDGLSLFLVSYRPNGYGNGDIYVTIRSSRNEPWGEPVNLGSNVNTSYEDTGPSISSDGLTLYFFSNRPGGYGGQFGDLWMTTRENVSDHWNTPVNLGPTVNSSHNEFLPCISADNLSLYFTSDRPDGGDDDIWVTKRANISEPWGTPTNLGPNVNSLVLEQGPSISSDGLTLFFESGRSGNSDIWVTKRAMIDDDWGTPVNLGPTVNTTGDEKIPHISPDGTTLYFTYKGRDEAINLFDIWKTQILPVVDFNSDGKIDNVDLLMLVESWGKYDPLYDIGPTPYGDGVVDIKDLEVFMSYWEKENIPEVTEEEL